MDRQSRTGAGAAEAAPAVAARGIDSVSFLKDRRKIVRPTSPGVPSTCRRIPPGSGLRHRPPRRARRAAFCANRVDDYLDIAALDDEVTDLGLRLQRHPLLHPRATTSRHRNSQFDDRIFRPANEAASRPGKFLAIGVALQQGRIERMSPGPREFLWRLPSADTGQRFSRYAAYVGHDSSAVNFISTLSGMRPKTAYRCLRSQGQ